MRKARNSFVELSSAAPIGGASYSHLEINRLLKTIAVEASAQTRRNYVDRCIPYRQNCRSLEEGCMKRAIAVVAVLITVGILSWAGMTVYRSQHTMSHDVLVKGRLALQALEHAPELHGFERTVENDHAATLFHEAEANRASDSDKRAVRFLQNYATAIHYVEVWTNDDDFCGQHHCRQLYETCKQESKMFDSGFVPSTSQCRNMAAEDK